MQKLYIDNVEVCSVKIDGQLVYEEEQEQKQEKKGGHGMFSYIVVGCICFLIGVTVMCLVSI